MRTMRVLSYHPHLGQPGELRKEIENAQAYVDAGFAEWVDRAADVETTVKPGAHETTVSRESPVRRKPTGVTETR
jgi:hypothetical protein